MTSDVRKGQPCLSFHRLPKLSVASFLRRKIASLFSYRIISNQAGQSDFRRDPDAICSWFLRSINPSPSCRRRCHRRRLGVAPDPDPGFGFCCATYCGCDCGRLYLRLRGAARPLSLLLLLLRRGLCPWAAGGRTRNRPRWSGQATSSRPAP